MSLLKIGRLAEHYLCASCGGFFIARDVQVDHIDPVVNPEVGFVPYFQLLSR